MNINVKVWRQNGRDAKGAFESHTISVVPEMSFLEMLDMVNEKLESEGKDPIAFEHDCREGICGSCGAMVNGEAHGPSDRTTLCQLHMRSYKDGDTVTIEPWRAEAFPVIKDLVVDRSSFDRIIQAGGFISVRTGAAQDANQTPIGKIIADAAFDAATCIGCGACVAACPNASASLFTSAKLFHLNSVPQGEVERATRTVAMTKQMDEEGFGYCTNHGECEASCPKGISISHIAAMNRDLLRATFFGK
ncbi:MAG: succinate dehydrogenase/fumarate reductase iron-sulfur subunit [Myxococcota bacterium]